MAGGLAQQVRSLSSELRLALAEATVPQVATFTGHSFQNVEAVLDAPWPRHSTR
jgi:hypothetical protein